jgi:predicted HTH domain antitoxin
MVQLPRQDAATFSIGDVGREQGSSLIIPSSILHTARMTVTELAREVAVLLYRKHKLTLGQASQLAEMSQPQLQHLLASRRIPVHHGVAEFEADLQTLRGWGDCDRRQRCPGTEIRRSTLAAAGT